MLHPSGLTRGLFTRGSTAELATLQVAAAGTSLRLVTATDGNHGRAVARMAGLLGLHRRDPDLRGGAVPLGR